MDKGVDENIQQTGFEFLGLEATTEVAGGMSLSTEVGEQNMCTICVYVLERIKQGYQFLLPSICIEVYTKAASSPSDASEYYASCHEVTLDIS